MAGGPPISLGVRVALRLRFAWLPLLASFASASVACGVDQSGTGPVPDASDDGPSILDAGGPDVNDGAQGAQDGTGSNDGQGALDATTLQDGGSNDGSLSEEASRDATTPMDGEAGPEAGPDAADATTDADATPPMDATPPVDATMPVDATPPPDATPPVDATPPADATTPNDAGPDASSGDSCTEDCNGQEAGSGAGNDAGPDAADAGIEAGTVDFVPGVTVTTLAGSDVAGEQDGTGAAAEFDNPTGVALDGLGNLVVIDYGGATVRAVSPAGVTTTVAAAPLFMGPFDVIVVGGVYYVGTDFDPSGVKGTSTGTIWSVTPLADGGVAAPVVVAQGFGRPRGLAPISAGTIFVTDRSTSVVDDVDVTTGVATLVAGSGTPGFQNGVGVGAQFSLPIGAAALPGGAVLVADAANNRIRQVAQDGTVTTFAGTGVPSINDGPRLTAAFSAPCDVAVDAAGNVYVSDAGNHRIRRIRIDGNVDTVAGDGTAGFQNGAGASAEFYGQEGLDVTADGKTIYVADGNDGEASSSPYHRIRAVAVP